MGIDPGLSNLGLAVITVDGYSNEVLSVTTKTITPDKIKFDYGLDSETQRDRVIRLNRLREELIKELHYYKPITVACESAFYNPRTPGAYAPLVESIAALQSALMEYDSNIYLHTLAPLLIKTSIGAKTTRDKNLVKQALLEKSDLNIPDGYLDALSDHAIDALAIAYTHFKNQGLSL